jgi:hypothetical protein
MLDRTLLPPHIVITAQDLQNTPPAILALLEYLLQENMALKKLVEAQGRQIEELRARLNLNSGNSSRPPSTDSLYKSKETGKDRKEVRGEEGPQRAPSDPSYPHGNQNHPA